MNCPLKTSEDWKQLVSAVGERGAYHALVMNNNIIPSRFKAKMLIDNFNGKKINISNFMESKSYTGTADNDFDMLYKYEDMENEVDMPGKSIDQKLIASLDALSEKFQLEYDFVTARQAEKLLANIGQALDDATKGFWYGGSLYVIDNRIDEETVLHEFAHPFIELFYKENNSAFMGIYRKLSNTATGQDIINEVSSEPGYHNDEERIKEVMVRAISRSKKEIVHESKFLALVKELLNGLKNAITKFTGLRVISEITEDTTISELASLIYDTDFSLPIDSSILAGKVLKFDVTKELETLAEEDNNLEQYKDADGHQWYRHKLYPDQLKSNSEDTVQRMTNNKTLRDKLAKRAKYVFASKNINTETGIYTDEKGNKYNFEEYIDFLDSVNDDYRAIGTILHAYSEQLFIDKTKNPTKWGELDAEINQIFMQHPNLKRSKILEPLKQIDPNTGLSVMKTMIMRGLGIVHKDFGSSKVGRKDDILLSEVKMALKELGIGTAADLIQVSDNGAFSFYDFKFGRSFSNLSDATPSLHGAGTNVSQSTQDLAFMDLVKRVFMAKVLLGDKLKVSNVKIMHVTPGYTYRNLHTDPNYSVKAVDMQPYLTILKRSLIAEGKQDLVDKWEKLGYFKESTYRVLGQDTLDELNAKDLKTLPERREYLMGQIELMTNLLDSTRPEDRDATQTKNNRERLMKLTESLVAIDKDPDMPLYSLYEDTSPFRTLFGSQYDQTNPYAQMAMAFYRKQKAIRDDKSLSYKKEFQRLVDKILDDNKGERLLRNIIGTNPRKVFGPLYIEKTGIHGYGTYMISKIEDKTEWDRRVAENIITKEHEALFDFVTETWRKEYKNVAEHNLDKGFTRLDAYDRRFSNGLPEELPEGFLPRTMMSLGEIKQQFTFKQLDPAFWKMRWRRVQETLYDDDIYINKQESGLSRVKYMPNEKILQAENYSLNLESTFLSFTDNLLDVQYMDPAISYARGIKVLLTDNTLFRKQVTNVERTVKYLDRMVQLNMLKVKNKPYMIPMFGTKVNSDFLAQAIVTATSTTLLALHPAIAGFNVALIIMLSHIKAMSNEIHAWAGHREKVDFTIGDILRADAHYLGYIGSWLTGRVEYNKTHLLMEKFQFKATSYDYKSRAEDLRVGTSKLWDSSTLYVMNRIGEDYGAFVLFSAMIHHKKNPATGRSIYDSYVVKGNEVEWDTSEKNNFGVRGKVERGEDENGVMQYEEIHGLTSQEIATMKDITGRLNGRYREDEKTAIDVYGSAKIVTQFKKYMPVYLLESWSFEKYKDYSLERYVVKGMDNGVAVLGAEKEVFGGSIPLAANALWRAGKAAIFLEKWDKSKITRKEWEKLAELSATAAVMIGYAFATGALGPDDDKKRKWRASKTGQRLNRMMYQDITRMANPLDILNNLVTPFPSLSFLLKFLTAWGEYLNNLIKGTKLRNGKIKGARQAWNLAPILNVRNDIDKYYYNSPKEGQKTFMEFLADMDSRYR